MTTLMRRVGRRCGGGRKRGEMGDEITGGRMIRKKKMVQKMG